MGSPYLTIKSWFLANLMSRDNKIKVTLVLWHPRTLFSNVSIVFCLFISSQTVFSIMLLNCLPKENTDLEFVATVATGGRVKVLSTV